MMSIAQKIFAAFAALHKKNFKGLEKEVKHFLLRCNKKVELFCNRGFATTRSR